MFDTIPNFSYNNCQNWQISCLGTILNQAVSFHNPARSYSTIRNILLSSKTCLQRQKNRNTIFRPTESACLFRSECQNGKCAWLTDVQINGSLANCSISVIALLISTETTMIILSINRPAAEGVRLCTCSMGDYEGTRERDVFFWTPGNSKVGYMVKH